MKTNVCLFRRNSVLRAYKLVDIHISDSPILSSITTVPAVHNAASTTTSGPPNNAHSRTAAPPALPARLRRLSDASRGVALAAMEDAEARGHEVIAQALPDLLELLSVTGNVDSDGWDDDGEEDDDGELGVGLPSQVSADQSQPRVTTPADDPAHQPPSAEGAIPTDQVTATLDENDPDPFYQPRDIDDMVPNSSAKSRVHTHPAIRLLYILVAWLHTHFHLPFIACRAILVIVAFIISTAATSFDTSETYKTLPSVLNHLGVNPDFVVLPVCPECFEVYPASTPTSDVCARCDSPIFKAAVGHKKATPLLQFPVKSIEEQLVDILHVDGVEDLLEQWRFKERCIGKYLDNFDGEICKILKGPDSRPFFENPLPPETRDELRIGLTLGVDWYVIRFH